MEYMLFVIDLIGTVAFAFSGAMTAIRKEMDMLGVMILGMVTAVGGGIIRDIILGITPPQAFMEPVFALGAVLISVFVFAVFYFRGQRRKKVSVKPDASPKIYAPLNCDACCNNQPAKFLTTA